MKIILLTMLITVVFISCKKNTASPDGNTVLVPAPVPPAVNHPPVAKAGPDQVVSLPINSTTLDASSSFDPDNDIAAYQWSKISGPQSYTLSHPNNAFAQLYDLTGGNYLFELQVTDAGGRVSKDSIEITVIFSSLTTVNFNARQWYNACYDPRPGVCWINGDAPSYGINIPDNSNLLPDSVSAGVSVWVKMDTSNAWELVPFNCWQNPDPTPRSNFTFCLTPGGLAVWSWFFTMQNLEGRKADVRVVF